MFVTSDLPMAGGLVLLPKKLVRKSDWMRVDLPRPDSPGEGRERERERERFDNATQHLNVKIQGCPTLKTTCSP